MKPRAVLPILAIALLLAFAASGATGKTMSVQVRKGDLRAAPQFLAKIVATVSYGDRVEVLENSGSWMRVSPLGKNVSGWIHSSALSEKRIVLKSGGANAQVSASSGELALAGKGFNADIEAEFKAKHRNLDYTWIDRMEATEPPPDRVAAFLREGGLVPEKGAAR